MGYFDENEENKTEEGIEALAGEVSSKEEKRLEKERRKEEKRLLKEQKKQEKLERKMEKEGAYADLPEVSMADLKKAAADAAEESRKALEEVEQEEQNRNRKDAPSEEENATETEAKAETAEAAEAAEEEPESKKEKKKKKKKSRKERPEDVNIVKDLLTLIPYIGVVILICFLIVTFVGRRTTVHGDSMNPTLQSGDSLWVNMLAYKFGDPQRYDIIVFPYQDDVHYIKRIIGLPGETVQITDTGDILINGEVLVEPKKFDRIRSNGIASSPITLGEDEYFVLGDNRNNSRDSRWADVGNIKRDKIIGRAAFRLTPLKKFGSID